LVQSHNSRQKLGYVAKKLLARSNPKKEEGKAAGTNEALGQVEIIPFTILHGSGHHQKPYG